MTSALIDSGITGSFDTKNAGTGKTVTISGLTLTGADAGKYMLDAADPDRGHHAGDVDRHGHHRKRQDLRRHDSRGA